MRTPGPEREPRERSAPTAWRSRPRRSSAFVVPSVEAEAARPSRAPVRAPSETAGSGVPALHTAHWRSTRRHGPATAQTPYRTLPGEVFPAARRKFIKDAAPRCGRGRRLRPHGMLLRGLVRMAEAIPRALRRTRTYLRERCFSRENPNRVSRAELRRCVGLAVVRCRPASCAAMRERRAQSGTSAPAGRHAHAERPLTTRPAPPSRADPPILGSEASWRRCHLPLSPCCHRGSS
jgi:hypothetical protein